jgi:hypothetical protein
LRSLVERVIRTVKEWKELKFRRLTPQARESLTDHFDELETSLDCVIALTVLNFLAKNGRLETIPTRTPRGFENRIITNAELRPVVEEPKLLPAKLSSWPSHLREFKDALSVLGPELAGIFATIMKKTDKHELSTRNVHLRGANLAKSGHVALISVAKDLSAVDTWLIEAEVWGSMRQVVYLCGLRITKGSVELMYVCSCTNG